MLYEESGKKCNEIVATVQLNQRAMQSLQLVQSKVGEFIAILESSNAKEQKDAQIQTVNSDLKPVLTDALRNLHKRGTAQQKFVSATMFFDVFFNIPDKRYQLRVLQCIIRELPDCNIAYQLLQQAFDKANDLAFDTTVFDPVLEALFATLMISSLNNEDERDPEM